MKEDTSEKLTMPRNATKKLDWWTEIADEEKAAIKKGLEDVKARRVKPHKEAKELYAKWL